MRLRLAPRPRAPIDGGIVIFDINGTVEAAGYPGEFGEGMAVVVTVPGAERGCSILHTNLDTPAV